MRGAASEFERLFRSHRQRDISPSAREQIHSLVELHVDGVLEVDTAGNVLAANARIASLTGVPVAELLELPATRIVAEDQLPMVRSQWGRVFAGETVEYHSLVACKDGRRLPVRVTAIPVFARGRVVSMYAIVRDITVERSTMTQLIEYTDRIRTLNAVATSSGASAKQLLLNILECGAQLLGVDSALVTRAGETTLEVVHAFGEGGIPIGTVLPHERTLSAQLRTQGQPLLIDDLSKAPWDAHPARAVLTWRSFGGGAYVVHGARFGTVVFGGNLPRRTTFGPYDSDLIESVCTLIGFVVERVLHEDQMNALAFHDPLTGLANRALMNEQLVARLANARRNGTSVAHFIDLDRFKYVNDTYGHAAGDEVLRVVARRIERTCREDDVLARVGGDEFVLIQSGLSSAVDAAKIAGRIIQELKAPIRSDGAVYDIGVSMGVAIFPGDAETADAILASADAALYEAKNRGRGQARFANADYGALLKVGGEAN